MRGPALLCGALASLLGSATAAQAAGPLFACGFGTKQVLVSVTPGGATYRFGPAGRPEKTITGRAGANLFRGYVLYPRAANTHLRFTDGPFSYVLFHRLYLGDARQRGAEDTHGLLVLRDGKLLARRVCRSGPGLADVELAKALPGTPADTGFDLADFM